MLLYTIIPTEVIFEDPECDQDEASEVEIKKGNVSFMVQPIPGGKGRINRILSTDPQDYLDPQWQPGTVVDFFGTP